MIRWRPLNDLFLVQRAQRYPIQPQRIGGDAGPIDLHSTTAATKFPALPFGGSQGEAPFRALLPQTPLGDTVALQPVTGDGPGREGFGIQSAT